MHQTPFSGAIVFLCSACTQFAPQTNLCPACMPARPGGALIEHRSTCRLHCSLCAKRLPQVVVAVATGSGPHCCLTVGQSQTQSSRSAAAEDEDRKALQVGAAPLGPLRGIVFDSAPARITPSMVARCANFKPL